ncbi:MAG: class II aldolase/adducin family protein [Rhodoferax sp.]
MAQTGCTAQAGADGLRRSVLEAAVRLSALGLNRGTSGNIGVRLAQSFLVTPSGVAAEELSPDALVEMDFSGAVLSAGKPSSEWRIHRDILLARADAGAVVHTHSRYATTLACLQREVPAFHYMIAAAGGDSIRCTPYALFGSQQLSDLALQALSGRSACLLGNHGMLALGADLRAALALAVEVEALCEQYWSALQLGQPSILSASQMQAVLEKFKTYGQRGRD